MCSKRREHFEHLVKYVDIESETKRLKLKLLASLFTTLIVILQVIKIIKMQGESTSQEGHTYRQWCFAILANLSMFSYGLQCGWISSSLSVLQSERSPTGTPLTNEEISWIASSLSLAAVMAVPVSSILVDRIGRKTCIILIGILQTISWVVTLCAGSTTCLIAARIFGGLGAGSAFNVVPMYVKEISQDNIRGTLGILLIVSQNLGILMMYTMGGLLDYHTVLWIVVGLPVVVVLILLKAPESPTYLIKIGKVDEAVLIISSLRGRGTDDKCVQYEIDLIKSEDEKFKSIPNVSFVGIFKVRPWRKGFVAMILVMVIHGLNGGFCIVNYASTIMQRSGVQISPEMQSLSVPVFMMFGSLVSMVTVERLGRRMILAGSFIISVVSFSALSTTLALQDNQVAVPGWLVITAAVLAVCAYAGGVSPIPFVIMSEMFNFQIRATVMGVLVTIGWLGSFVQLLEFVTITEAYGAHISFLCFAAINLVGVGLVLGLLPETKGKSVEQIENELDKTRLKK